MARLPEPSPLWKKLNSTMRDPRRTIVMYSTNSNCPRSKKWYRVAEACEFEGGLYLHRDYLGTNVNSMPQIVGARPTNRADAIKAAKAHAETTGNAYVTGAYTGYYGKPLARL